MTDPILIDTRQPDDDLAKAREVYGMNQRGRLWVYGDKHCHWCGQATLLTFELVPWQATIDHVIPRGDGGLNLHENVVSACLACNRRRNLDNLGKLGEGFLLDKMPVHPDGSRGFVPNSTGYSLHKFTTKAYKPPTANKLSAWNHPEIEIVRQQRDQGLAEIKRLNTLVGEVRSDNMLLKMQLQDAQQALGATTVRRLMVTRLRGWTDALWARLEGG